MIDPTALGDVYDQLASAARTAEFLISKNETPTPVATTMFLDRVLWAFPKAVELLERRAKGDYSSDPHLETLPEYRGPQKPSGPKAPIGDKGVKTARALFETYIKAAKLAPETILRRRGVFTELDALLDGRALDALADEEAQGWLTSMTERRSPSTVRRVYLVSLNALGRWAVRQKLITSNPFEQVKVVVPRKTLNRETRAFRADEVHTPSAGVRSIRS